MKLKHDDTTNVPTVPGEIIRDGQHGYVLFREIPTLQACFKLKGSKANLDSSEHAREIQEALAPAGTEGRRDNWRGGESTVAGCKKLANDGWREGVVKLQGETRRMKVSSATSIRRKKRMGPEGDFLDPHALNAGNIDRAWEYRKREHRPVARAITIWCEITTAWSKTPEEMMWRGIAATAAAQLLQAAGYRVAVKGYVQLSQLMQKGPRQGPTLLVNTAKTHEERLNPARLCYLLSHASAYRTLGFLYKRSLPWLARGSLGHCDYGPPKTGILGPNDLCVSNLWTKEKALEWVRATIQKIDGNLKR